MTRSIAHRRQYSIAVLTCTLGPWMMTAKAETLTMQQLMSMSVRELARLDVTSVSKRPENLSNAPASIYVITRDDIRNSGVTTIPDALLLAPNLHVARGDASQYAVSARGFSNALGNKMLVLIDEVDEEGATGRSTADAPEIDGLVYLNGETGLKPGDMVKVRIDEADEYDLWASLVE